MSDLNEESIKILSKLSRIEITDEEIPALLADLKRVLDYVGELQKVDVSHLSPYSHVEEQGVSSLREDRVGDHLSKEAFLANAPDKVGGMVRTPPVFKQ